MNKRKFLFPIIATLLPVLFLVIIELFFIVFDLFPQPPLFTKENAVYKINSNVGERYFNKKNIPVPNLYPQTFSVTKDANTFRIFCLGGSSTAGFPYDMTVPFPKQLSIILHNDYPAKKFEVINMGLSAVNSFTLLDWISDILDHEPDLILLYTGHNEFYGAFGTGSTISLGHNASMIRFVLTIQKLRLVQMITAFTQLFVSEDSHDINTTIMEEIVEDRFIAANSELRDITHKNFSANLDLILTACRNNQIPVILSNLVSNLKDQPPLDSYATQTSDSSLALFSYRKGIDAYNRGDSANAYISFLEARDKDAVPFRANSKVNSIIYNKTRAYGAGFVDMDKAFRSLSPLSIPGNNLFCDHLHPNPIGYRIMANEFHRAILDTGLLPREDKTKKYVTTPEMVTGLDWEIGQIRIFELKHRWPFASKKVNYAAYSPYVNQITTQKAMDFLFKHHVWGRAHSEMAEYYEKSAALQKACAEYQAIVEMYPNKSNYLIKLIDCAKALKDWPVVKSACLKALKVSQVKGMFYYNLAISERMTGDMKSAIENIKKAIEAPELNRQQLSQFYYTYATFLLDIRQLSAAREMLEDLLKEVPDFEAAKKLLKQMPAG